MDMDPDVLKSVDRESAAFAVHRELRRAILKGTIAADSRLVETSLADRMNVSRTPIREAIQKLESEGLVRRIRSGGVIVENTASKIIEVLVLREGLEGATARLACARATVGEIAALSRQVQNAEAALLDAPQDVRSRLDREFHLMLAAASHSKRAIPLVEEFHEYSWGELWADMPPAMANAKAANLQVHHGEIVSALEARDADLAERTIRNHIAQVRQALETRLHRVRSGWNPET